MSIDSAALRAAIESADDLPTLPTVVERINARIANPSTNAADIGKLIEQDQVLTSRVLRLVNSSYYGFPRQIKSIQHAVVILGFSKIKTLVLSASVFNLIKQRDRGGLDVSRFWQHSLGAAIASKVVAETFALGHGADDAFIGGLLHDIGKIILDQSQPALYAPVIRRAKEKGILLLESEDAVMGVTHSQVGEWVMEKWRFPPAIINMVGKHHIPTASTERREMVGSVHLGDILARALGIGSGGDDRIPAIDPTVATVHAVDAQFLETTVDRIYSEFNKAGEFFSLISE